MASVIGTLKQMHKGNMTVETEDADMMVVPVGSIREVLVGYNKVLYGELAVAGSYIVNGTLIVDAIPT